MKTFSIILGAVAILAAAALSPYGQARWQFYRLTGSFTPQKIVENLQSPVAIDSITDKGLLTEDGKLLPVPGVTNLLLAEALKKDIARHGVEISSDGGIYALVRVHHWCGNDPVVLHLARVNLSSLILLVEHGVRFSDYGFNPAYLPEAKKPWSDIAEEVRRNERTTRFRQQPPR